ncbi:ATP-binding protein [Endothiovibrio diazotrophicus]
MDASTPRETRILADTVDHLYRRHGSVSLLLLLSVAVFALEAAHYFPSAAVLAWSGGMLLTLWARERLLARYLRRPPPAAEAPRWGRRFTLAALAIGLAWGVAGTLFCAPQHPTYTAFLVVFITGHALSGIPVLAWRVETYYAYTLPTIAPVLLQLLFSERFDWQLIGALGLPMTALALYLAHRIHASFAENIALRYENLELLEHLKVEKERAERAYRANSRFLAAASHDLRQPLHALTLYLDPLADELAAGPDNGTHHAALAEKARASAQGLTELLNTILDLSRLDAGTVHPQNTAVALAPLFEQLHSELASQFAAKGLRLRLRPIDGWVESDPVLACRVLRNLLVNALRFTERGGVLLAARRRGDRIDLEVWDSGIGIPSAARESIFDEYVQLNNPERDRDKGLGLGLAIVRRLTRVLGVELSVASRVGRGSRFRLRFPAARRPAAPAAEGGTADGATPTAGGVAGLRVLVIDDSRESLDAIATLLERWGCRVLAAADLEQAERQLEGAAAPEAIVADYRLARGRDGIEVVEALRARYRRAIPALIVTGDTSGAEWERIHASGIPALHKPLPPARLRAFLGRVRTGRQPPGRSG